jgi:hypothetical protein
MIPLAENLEKRAKTYYHLLLVIIATDLILNLGFLPVLKSDLPSQDITPGEITYLIMEFIFLAGILYCLSTRNQALKDLKEENARNPVS